MNASSSLLWGQTWPDIATFRELAKDRRVIPVVRRVLADEVTPIGLYRALAQGKPGTFIMESADAGGAWSRWSFIGVSSRAQLLADDGQARWIGDVPVGIPQSGPVLDVLKAALDALKTPSDLDVDLPPFTGGLAGALGWGIVRQWEPTLPAQAPDELHAPPLALALATDMVALDHHTGTVWLIANAINMDDRDARVDWAHGNAVERLDGMAEQIAQARPYAPAVVTADAVVPDLEFRSSQAEFETAVRAGKAAIRDGEVFQVVLSQRIDLDSPADPLEVYRALRTINPSPYMYFFHLGEMEEPAAAGGPNKHGHLGEMEEPAAAGGPNKHGHLGEMEVPAAAGGPNKHGHLGEMEEPSAAGGPNKHGHLGEMEEPAAAGGPDQPGHLGDGSGLDDEFAPGGSARNDLRGRAKARTICHSAVRRERSIHSSQARDFYIVGSSPETLVKVDRVENEREVLTFPIAGSRPRGKTPQEDVKLGEELLDDPKERSEHVMLVDLARNDLAKVCRPGTVTVAEFMALRRFSHIMHICSTVIGQLDDDADALDALLATFPAGTLSGAPKPRAIALIDELEPAARGVYGGTVGYFDFAGNLDMAIAIRTAFIRARRASVQAGAGIVADSDPETEYLEARNKAAAAVRAVQLAAQLKPLSAPKPEPTNKELMDE